MTLPSQTQLLLPLLESLSEAGGRARPRDLYDSIAAKVQLPADLRQAEDPRADRGKINLFERRVRWTRQTAVLKGLIEKGERANWVMTGKAHSKLQNIQRGMVFTIFETDKCVFLWANAEDAVAYVEPGSVDLIMTSPPYPLLTQREYGNLAEQQWLDWMLKLCESWLPLLTSTGSLMINLGRTWKPGVPAQSNYIERFVVRAEDELGIHKLQHLDWHSPCKMPSPLKWVGIERVRLTSSVEPLLWMSPNPNAKGNNRHVLRPYTAGGLRAIREAAKPHRTALRPAGYKLGLNSHRDVGGSIPPSLITTTPMGKLDQAYRKACRAQGRVPHPASMPTAVAEFGILLATDEYDTVADFMAGSFTVPLMAAKHNRYGIGADRSRHYVEDGMIRAKSMGLYDAA